MHAGVPGCTWSQAPRGGACCGSTVASRLLGAKATVLVTGSHRVIH